MAISTITIRYATANSFCKKEISRIEAKLKEKGYTLIPLRIFFTDKNLVKIEIGLAKGKKLHDKRDTLRQKDAEREMKRYLK